MALEAAPDFGTHLPEESLEQYAFGRLPASELEAVEQHLLVCESCRGRLETEDNFAEVIQVLAKMADPPGNATAFARISQVAAVFRRPPVFMAAFPAILIVGFATWRLAGSKETPVAEMVALAALRGGAEAMTQAHAGRALDLSIGIQAIADSSPQGGDYRLELVNTVGVQVWTGTASATADKIVARVSRPLSAGTYWVRLYAPSGRLLREFGLQVQ